jgi:small subunit ribosomal protein S8
MSIQDPIADMLTRIRNAQNVKYEMVAMPSSTIKLAIAKVLMDEGYIRDFRLVGEENKPVLEVLLKYHNEKGVIEKIKRISRPGLRIYKGYDELAKNSSSYGITIVSTSKGVMSSRVAKAQKLGGEVLCVVW